MKSAIAVLEAGAETAETNEPINRAAGNIDQANLEKVTSQECRAAIRILQS